MTFNPQLAKTNPAIRVSVLEECLEAIIDYRGKSPRKTEFGIPLITARIIKDGQIKPPTEFIAEDDYDTWMSRGLPKAGDVVFTTEAPCGEVAQLDDRKVALAQRVLLLRGQTGVLDNAFLKWVLRSGLVTSQLNQRSTGSTVVGIRQKEFRKISIPLPPLAEQRRIAEVLDRAEALRAKRRAALAQLDSLTQSLFLDLFGDPVSNPKGWPMVTLENVLSIPLRNGLSPSKSGKVHANVLTLSAITGNRFDATAWKTSTFMTRPPANQSVSELDFLICRGNGNVHMVGKGYFPCEAMPEMTFPDTMIAARISTERIERAFLQHVWNSSAVRKQVEAVARTTNGTFKVNQPSLEGILFVSPPIKLQREFARRVTAVETLKTAHRASLAELDGLFATLQHRAFRGEL